MTRPSEGANPKMAASIVEPDRLISVATTAAETGFASGQAFLSGLQAMNSELLEFWSGRLARCCELAGQLAECRSANEALPVQQQYVQDMVRAYAALVPRLTVPFVDAERRSGREPRTETAGAGHARAA